MPSRPRLMPSRRTRAAPAGPVCPPCAHEAWHARAVQRVEAPAFDVVGDLHGALPPLLALLDTLGYAVAVDGTTGALRSATHPTGRVLLFVGDLGDRGLTPARVMASVRALVEEGPHHCVLGNHDRLAQIFLAGAYHTTDYLTGFETTFDDCGALSADETARLLAFFSRRPAQLTAGRPGRGTELVVTHAGIDRGRVGRRSAAATAAAIDGAFSRAHYEAVQRHDAPDAPTLTGWLASWAEATTGPTLVFGHIALRTPLVRGRLVAIDTGSVFGNALSAYRFPERTVVSVPGWMDAAASGGRRRSRALPERFMPIVRPV